jgi:hypothetical protein
MSTPKKTKAENKNRKDKKTKPKEIKILITNLKTKTEFINN